MLLLFDLYTNLKKKLKNLEIKRQCDLLSITYIFQLISITYIHKYTHTHTYIYKSTIKVVYPKKKSKLL